MVALSQVLRVAIAGYVVHRLISWYRVKRKIKHIPTLGSDNALLYYLVAWRDFFGDDSRYREGYKAYPGGAFKIPSLVTSSGWLIVVNGEEMTDELCKAPSDVMARCAAIERMKLDYLIPSLGYLGDFEAKVVRGQLTRAMTSHFGDVHDEIMNACSRYLPCEKEWKAVRMHETTVEIICRTTNRLYVGLPFNRQPEYQKIQSNWTLQVMIAGQLIGLADPLFKPIAGGISYLLLRSGRKRTQQLMGPIIQERLENYRKYGEDWDRPEDVITWLIEMAPQEWRNVEGITLKLMLLNFASIHTSSLALTNALFDLAARPQYIEGLREEVESVIGNHGWTKEAMGMLRKLDSFLKESSRMAGLGAIPLMRLAEKDFMFSNGVFIPAGYAVLASSSGIHHDPEIYEDPETFNGLRFFEADKDQSSARSQMVSLDTSFLPFGNGKHACPGRFFAVTEIKAIIAHVIVNYDLMLPGGSKEIPPPLWMGGNRAPNQTAEVLFRARTSPRTF